MTLIKVLSDNFDPAYVKPRNVARAARQLVPTQSIRMQHRPSHDLAERRRNQRRIQHRRQQQHHVLMDVRSPQSRRKSPGRRQSDNWSAPHGHYGIDTYA